MQKEFQFSEQFSKIKCKDFGKLILTQGDSPSLVIDADEEYLSELVAEVRGETLALGFDKDWMGRVGKVISSFINGSEREVTYHLTVVDLDQISISGKINLECDSFQTEKLALKVSGLGELNFDHLDCDSLEVDISGRGELTAAGRADHQTLRISGSGEVHTPNLASQSVRIAISGQGNATIRVEDHLDIAISGVGQVKYYGSPKLQQVISGAGSSKRLNEA